MEDLTSPEVIRQNLKCDRTVSLYGYVRGIPLCKNNNVHIPGTTIWFIFLKYFFAVEVTISICFCLGCGDSKISDICFLPDPCPLPDKLKKRSLVDKEKIVYAPFSGVGGIVYDKDAVYVELAGSHSHKKVCAFQVENKRFFSSLVYHYYYYSNLNVRAGKRRRPARAAVRCNFGWKQTNVGS